MKGNMTNEAYARVKIDALLAAQGWNPQDTTAVRYEVVLPDGTRADYVLCDRHGRSLAVIEAKRFAVSPNDAAAQAKAYAQQLGVPYIFLSNGHEVLFWEWQREAYPHPVKTLFKQDDLERRAASLTLRKDVSQVPIDRHIVERDYQIECIDTLCQQIVMGRRKLLVEMATGTGKTRTAAALIKRLFEANVVTRVLFLVDRIPLAKQTEDAFAEHLPDYPAYVLRTGRRFQDEKRITITTLQSMVNLYADYSSGYFDLVISDECHRSIYGQWSGVLKHFDGVQIGLTATPCVLPKDENSDGSSDKEDQAFVRDTLRFFEVDAPTFSYKMKDAIRDGHLVPYQVYKAQTIKTAAEDGFKVKKTELDWSAMDAASRDELEKLFAGRDELTVDPSALERKFTIPERNRAIVREYAQVLEQGFVDTRGVLRKPLIGKTIVFAVNKRHAETLAQLFDAQFAHLKPSPDVRFADYVVSGQGADDTTDGMSKIRRFKKEPYPQILVSVNMLDTGFDCPEVVNLIFARFTRSSILYQQMRGRGTRKSKNKPVFTCSTSWAWSITTVTTTSTHPAPWSNRRPNAARSSPGACCRLTWTTTSTPPPASGSRWTKTATWSSPKPPNSGRPSWAHASKPGFSSRTNSPPARKPGCAWWASNSRPMLTTTGAKAPSSWSISLPCTLFHNWVACRRPSASLNQKTI